MQAWLGRPTSPAPMMSRSFAIWSANITVGGAAQLLTVGTLEGAGGRHPPIAVAISGQVSGTGQAYSVSSRATTADQRVDANDLAAQVPDLGRETRTFDEGHTASVQFVGLAQRVAV